MTDEIMYEKGDYRVVCQKRENDLTPIGMGVCMPYLHTDYSGYAVYSGLSLLLLSVFTYLLSRFVNFTGCGVRIRVFDLSNSNYDQELTGRSYCFSGDTDLDSKHVAQIIKEFEGFADDMANKDAINKMKMQQQSDACQCQYKTVVSKVVKEKKKEGM